MFSSQLTERNRRSSLGYRYPWPRVRTSVRTRQRRDTLILQQGKSQTDSIQKEPLRLLFYVTRLHEFVGEDHCSFSTVNELLMTDFQSVKPFVVKFS